VNGKIGRQLHQKGLKVSLNNQRAARLFARMFFSGFLIKKKSAAERTTSMGDHFIGPLAQAYVGPIVVRMLSCAGNGFVDSALSSNWPNLVF
jgi:hypothetical protein